MAKKPVVDIDVLIKTLKDDVHIGGPHQTHGYRSGLIINVSQEFEGDHEAARTAADILIKMGQAEPADGISVVKAKARGQEEMEKARQLGMKKASEANYTEFDDLPPELRQLIRDFQERGDDITSDVAQLLREGNTIPDIVRAYQPH